MAAENKPNSHLKKDKLSVTGSSNLLTTSLKFNQLACNRYWGRICLYPRAGRQGEARSKPKQKQTSPKTLYFLWITRCVVSNLKTKDWINQTWFGGEGVIRLDGAQIHYGSIGNPGSNCYLPSKVSGRKAFKMKIIILANVACWLK